MASRLPPSLHGRLGRLTGLLVAALGPALMLPFAACGAAPREPAATAGPAATPPAGQAPASGTTRPALEILRRRFPELLVGPEAGRWMAARDPQGGDLAAEQKEAIERLEAVGYLGGVTEAPAARSVTRHDRARALAGVNLVTSGHAPEAWLMDMEGQVLHRWRCGLDEAWPSYVVPDPKHVSFWRKTHLFPNGDLVATFEGHGIVRMDSRSQILWSSTVRAHHDLAVAPDGKLLVLTREAHVVPRVNPVIPILEDFVTVLDGATGRALRQVSVLRAVERSAVPIAWEDRKETGGDLFHTNSIEILDGSLADRIPAFRRGNLLLSLPYVDLVAVLDPREERIVWALSGEFRAQHDARMLPNGHILLFDNLGPEVATGERSSAVLEIDPLTGAVVWSYRGSAAEPFYSLTCGTSRRLGNGNTLVTESDSGRAFEVTAGGDVVWEYYNPHRSGDREEYIAALFEVVRHPEGALALPLP